MRKLILLSVLASSLFLGACSLTSQTTTESDTTSTDTSSDSSSNTDSTTTNTTSEEEVYIPVRASKECSVSNKTSLVANFPDDIPLYGNATQTDSQCKPPSTTEYEMRFKTYDKLEDVTSDIIAQLEENGWKVDSQEDLTKDYDVYDYYILVTASKAGGLYGRTAIYDIRNDRFATDGAGEIILRERYEEAE